MLGVCCDMFLGHRGSVSFVYIWQSKPLLTTTMWNCYSMNNQYNGVCVSSYSMDKCDHLHFSSTEEMVLLTADNGKYENNDSL